MEDRVIESLLFPVPDNAVADRLRRVAHLLVADDEAGARAEIAPLAGITRSTHPRVDLPMRALGPRPKTNGTRTKAPAQLVRARVYLRDGFTCVYCGRWTIPERIMQLISLSFPNEFPYRQRWPAATTAKAYCDISTTVDHVQAVSTDGDWQAPSNLVTACWRCQEQKSNYSLQALGWTVRNDWETWDGLTSLYVPLWKRLGNPNPKEYEPWIRAFAAAHQANPAQDAEPPIPTDAPRADALNVTAPRKSRTWTRDEWFALVRETRSPAEVDAIERVFEWAHARGMTLAFGTSQNNPSARFSAPGIRGALLYIYPGAGGAQVSFANLAKLPAFAPEPTRLQLLEKLNALPGVAISQARVSRWPSFALQVLTVDSDRQAFLDAMDGMLTAISAPSGS